MKRCVVKSWLPTQTTPTPIEVNDGSMMFW
jgi:hypothetical protein